VGRTQFIWETKLIPQKAKRSSGHKTSDDVVMVREQQSGEGRSRSDIGLPGVQQELLPFTKLIQI
jgi:beta-glucosidase